MPILEAKALRKIFRLGEHSVNALAGVDFLVEKGEFVALMGRSGSGKSTLLALMAGLDRPSEGQVILDGREIQDLSEDDLALLRPCHREQRAGENSDDDQAEECQDISFSDDARTRGAPCSAFFRRGFALAI